ncbi:MAG: threonine synthase [Ichthyobacteriaceae bacterium]|nr:threonine synthase [Ichthyobacteriaceae bacterium]
MKYYSTRDKNNTASFKEAVRKGLASDGGLFVPETIEKLPKEFFDNIKNMSAVEMATQVMKTFVGNEIPEAELSDILKDVLDFDFPLVEVEKNKFALELFHGPTLAFKDVGARFLARCLGYFAQQDSINSDKKQAETVTVLVATSGDTGSAVANGFYGVEGTEVVILYPSGKVSKSQEQQLTTYGGNITALEVDGTFDDCQAMVKSAFQDGDLNKKLNLSSANSINIARFIPQSLYYFIALGQKLETDKDIVLSVPSGNFGNILAAIYAKNMGLKIDKFVISNNANNTVVDYLNTGKYESRASVATLSNAMDVGAPSNFERLIHLYPELDGLKEIAEGYSYSDKDTLECIEDVYKRTGYLADPHGAVGFLGLSKSMESKENAIGIFAETAHPAKFVETFTDSQIEKLEIPERLLKFMDQEKVSIKMDKSFNDFKAYLMQR